MPAQTPAVRVVTSSIEESYPLRLDELDGFTGRHNCKGRTVTSKTNRVKRPGYWDDVEVGDSVTLTRNGSTEYTGEVDTRTADGDIVWVRTPVGGRRLFHINDGFELTWSTP
jgi:hypothetical protein